MAQSVDLSGCISLLQILREVRSAGVGEIDERLLLDSFFANWPAGAFEKWAAQNAIAWERAPSRSEGGNASAKLILRRAEQ